MRYTITLTCKARKKIIDFLNKQHFMPSQNKKVDFRFSDSEKWTKINWFNDLLVVFWHYKLPRIARI